MRWQITFLQRTLLLSVLSVAVLRADLISSRDYSFRWCSDADPTCGVAVINRIPPATDLAWFTDNTFQQYFAPILNGKTGTFMQSSSITDSNSAGIVIGRAYSPIGNIDAQFIYRSGAITCCFTDIPFKLYDINDNGLVAGYSPYPGRLGAGLLFGGVMDAVTLQPYDIRITGAPSQTGPDFSANTAFIGIDNQNRILGDTGKGRRFALEPIPEPSSILLLATAIAAAGYLVRRRHGRSSTPD